MKIFHLVTENCIGKNIEIDFSEHELVQLIRICYQLRRNKGIGVRLGKIYLESKGREGKESLRSIGINPDDIEKAYSSLVLSGRIH